MFSEHWSRKIYMNYLRLQQVICKFADWWLCWLWARMILVFSIVADLWCGWWWFSWSLLTLLTFGADDDGGRLLLLVFSARAANFTTRLFLIMPGGHKLLMVGTNGTNYTNWLLANLSTTTAATINTSCIIYSPNNYLSTHSYDVVIWLATSIKHIWPFNIPLRYLRHWQLHLLKSLFLFIFLSTAEERGQRTLWVGWSSTLWQGKYLVSSRDAAWYGPTN